VICIKPERIVPFHAAALSAKGRITVPGNVLMTMCRKTEIPRRPGFSKEKRDHTCESCVLGQDKYQIGLPANLDRIPENGALVVVVFPKPFFGSGFPAGVFAILPRPMFRGAVHPRPGRETRNPSRGRSERNRCALPVQRDAHISARALRKGSRAGRPAGL